MTLDEATPNGDLNPYRDAETASGMTRRRLLAIGAQGGLAIGAGSLLAACGASGSSGTTKAATAASGTAVRGGTLKVGMITGGSAETLNPGAAGPWVDILRVYQLYDFLFDPGFGQDFTALVPRLATSAEPNHDASVWTIKLRDGVHWHDGKPFSADDVVWTIGTWSNVANYANSYVAPFIDFKRVRKRGRLEVEIPLLRSAAEFPAITTVYSLAIVQNGATPKSFSTNPVGTGPFKYVSFQPGSQSVFARNPDYWDGANTRPYVDKVIVTSSFQDETSRYNALQGGEIDVSGVIPGTFARQAAGSSINLINSPSGSGQCFTMRCDRGPFADVRVRQAMKLLCNRQALIDGVFPGYAAVGNDVEGRFTKYYDMSLHPTYDVEKAKSLLKAAGQQDLNVTLQTSNASPGFTQAATLYAQQAAQAGVKINVQTLSPSVYYTSAGGYLGRAFGQDDGNSWASMMLVAATYFVKGCPYDETGWTTQPGGGDQALVSQAIGELNPSKAQELWTELQKKWQSEDGHLIWSWANFTDAAANKIHGLSGGIAQPLNNFNLVDAWIAE